MTSWKVKVWDSYVECDEYDPDSEMTYYFDGRATAHRFDNRDRAHFVAKDTGGKVLRMVPRRINGRTHAESEALIAELTTPPVEQVGVRDQSCTPREGWVIQDTRDDLYISHMSHLGDRNWSQEIEDALVYATRHEADSAIALTQHLYNFSTDECNLIAVKR